MCAPAQHAPVQCVLQEGEEEQVAVYIEPFSIDKCLNLYLSVFRWMQKPFRGGSAGSGRGR